MRLAFILILLAGPALAHPGHLIEAGGHDHWTAGVAIGAAVLIGLWGALKGKKRQEPEAEDAEELEEEAA